MKSGHLGYSAPEGGMYGPDPQTFFDRSCQESTAGLHGRPAGASGHRGDAWH